MDVCLLCVLCVIK